MFPNSKRQDGKVTARFADKRNLGEAARSNRNANVKLWFSAIVMCDPKVTPRFLPNCAVPPNLKRTAKDSISVKNGLYICDFQMIARV